MQYLKIAKEWERKNMNKRLFSISIIYGLEHGNKSSSKSSHFAWGRIHHGVREQVHAMFGLEIKFVTLKVFLKHNIYREQYLGR